LPPDEGEKLIDSLYLDITTACTPILGAKLSSGRRSMVGEERGEGVHTHRGKGAPLPGPRGGGRSRCP
jgi:hypothetical protein